MGRNPVQRELDNLVILSELTLLSIIQAIALSFLAEASLNSAPTLQAVCWPYILTGLLVIFVFWSRSLMHVLTIIRWPLEFVHNFLYITFTLVESVMFRQIGSVGTWFALSLVSALLIWALFAFDLRMLRRLKVGNESPAFAALVAAVEKDQRFQLKAVAPAMVVFSAAAWGLVLRVPELFVEQSWHLALVALQASFLLGYLAYSLRLYRRIVPLIPGAMSE